MCGALLYVCVFRVCRHVSWPLLTVEGKPHERDGKREERRRTRRTRKRKEEEGRGEGLGIINLRREEKKKEKKKKKKKKRFSLGFILIQMTKQAKRTRSS